MKQVLQNLRTGAIELADVPCPIVRAGHLLIQTRCSLISAGTERMLVEFGQAGLIGKARSQPEKVKQVLAKIRTDGLLPTLEAVFSRLDEPMPLGYCNVGRVVEVGRGVEGFSVGDRVASNGPHAEMVCVPSTLAARVPDAVPDEHASFTVLSSIALHGVRLLEPTLGERFVVFGLGLLGLIGAQFLLASGARVLGVDVNAGRCALARSMGCEATCLSDGVDPARGAEAFTGGAGVDGVLVAAAAKNDAIMHQAAQMCRKRGRIVLVGVVDLNLARADFYEKELSFKVSCSYGPGRYDPAYEGQTRDYPRPYVRWTVARNFAACAEAMETGRLNVDPLISRRIPHGRAAEAYDSILKDSSVLGAILTYPDQPPPTDRVLTLRATPPAVASQASRASVAVVGAGNFTKLVLLPAIRASGAELLYVASAGGVNSLHSARKFEAESAASDFARVLDDPRVRAVFITTRHGSHAAMVCDALQAGKHVFVEKPLAIDEAGLDRVRQTYARHSQQQLMVGFNRRFAPHTVAARDLLTGRTHPIAVQIVVNAGEIPASHWTQDAESGGGRIIGEGCHFIDLALHLVGSTISAVQAVMFGQAAPHPRDDKMSIQLSFADGSIASIQYWANGPKSYPKERVEIFSEGRALVIDNWRRMIAYDWPHAARMNIRQDKGHKAETIAFIERVTRGGPPLIPFDQLDQVTLASFAAVRSAREGVTIRLALAPSPPREAALAQT